MSKDEKCTWKASKNTVFHCEICKFVGFLLPSSSWLLKLPILRRWWTRTAAKYTKMKIARALCSKLLFFIIKYANLRLFCHSRRPACLCSLLFWSKAIVTHIPGVDFMQLISQRSESSWEGLTLETSTYLSSCCHSLTHIKSFGILNVRVSLSHWRSTIFSSETKAVVRFVQLFTILCLALWYHNFETALVFLAASRSTWLENDLPRDWSLEKVYWWRLTFSQPIRKPSSYIAKKIALKMASAQVVQK